MRRANCLLWGLLALQMIAIVTVYSNHVRRDPGVERPRSFIIGDTIATLVGQDSIGRPDTVRLQDSPKWTLVLAFSSTCAHCEAVAPKWSQWLQTPKEGLQTIAMTRDAPAQASVFRDTHGWRTDLLSVQHFAPKSAERALTGRTPWLYLVNPSGQLVLMDHGSRLEAVDSTLRAAR